MMLSNIRVVMVNPSHPGNIGAAARAMKNMGLSELVLVDYKKPFPDQVAMTRSSGAHEILQNATIVNSLADALSGVELVFGTSARKRHLSCSLVSPREMGDKLQANLSAKVALVFGRENSGLTNEELSLCHFHVHIPTNPEFSSLNLSQAIQLLCYECRLALEDVSDSNTDDESISLATVENTEGFFSHLEKTLSEIGFLDPKQPKLLMIRLRRLFARAQLEATEIHILRGILSRIDRIVMKLAE